MISFLKYANKCCLWDFCPKKMAAPVLVDLKAWEPFVVQVSSLPDHHLVNGYPF